MLHVKPHVPPSGTGVVAASQVKVPPMGVVVGSEVHSAGPRENIELRVDVVARIKRACSYQLAAASSWSGQELGESLTTLEGVRDCPDKWAPAKLAIVQSY
jgi:hypothetical protein